ncbi:hypothetical protein Nmel_001939 [Mimus melanotis]
MSQSEAMGAELRSPGSSVGDVDQTEDPPLDLLGPHPVDDGVEHGGHQDIDVAHDDVHQRSQVLAKPVHHGQPDEGHVEGQHHADVGDAGAEHLEPLPPGRQAQHGLEDEEVGEADEHGIQPHDQQDGRQPVHHAGGGVGARQVHHVLVQAEGVRQGP